MLVYDLRGESYECLGTLCSLKAYVLVMVWYVGFLVVLGVFVGCLVFVCLFVFFWF